MDRGLTIENPYASVTIPQAQLNDGFLRYYLGDDLTSGTVLFSPSILPTYSAAPEKGGVAPASNGQRAQAQEELQAQPTNPYASLKMPRADAPEPFRWKSDKGAAPDRGGGCCSPCCPKCSPCCRKLCCIVS
ncbi:cysteine-rich tail protein 1 [Candoia aspera]|uniref:cysteine-rich tail protein 1 n=1 Tax=Candoia aspera TaxID=51853 RepID=UPI002FD83C3A